LGGTKGMKLESRVKVYKTRTCGQCPTLFQYLNNKKVDYEVIDCTDEVKRILPASRISGLYTVPQVKIGDEVVVGLNYGKLSDLLRRNGLLE
jgi:glutaredoxin